MYDKDPKKHADAVRFDKLTYDEVIARDLQVMDTAAFALCRDSDLPLRIFDMSPAGRAAADPARREHRHAGAGPQRPEALPAPSRPASRR